MSDSRRIVDPASLSLEEKEQLEIDWYLHATKPGGECDWSNVDSIINKFEYVVFFREELRKYSHYPLFKWTQQRQRSDCPEDLIQHTKLCVLAERAGFSSQMDFILDSILGQTNLLKALKWTNYMGALRFIPGLRRLPLSICTFVFRKAAD